MKLLKASEGLKNNLRAFVKEDKFESVVHQLENAANDEFAKTTEPESKVKTLYLATYEVESGEGFSFSYSKNDFVLEGEEDTQIDLSTDYMPLCDITEDMVKDLLDKHGYTHWIGVIVLINTQQLESVDTVVCKFRGEYKPQNAMVVFGNLTRGGLKVLGGTLIPFDDVNARNYLVRVI